MNQVKIGKFIKEKRKEKNITQSALAEMLNVTDRSVSKWENGNCMPDSSIILELCKILNITINDLFSGEIVDIKKYDEKLEKNLLEMIRQKEESDRRLLRMEIVLGLATGIPALIIMVICATPIIEMSELLRVLLIFISLIPFLSYALYAIRIEQTSGYYECKKCNHRYIPGYMQTFLAPHINRTRYMKCSKCNKYSWNKKVISGGSKNDK